MSALRRSSFDNVILRVQANRCLAASVGPPFRAAYWADIDLVGRELNLSAITGATLREPEAQVVFIDALANRVPGGAAFRPARIGFGSRPGDILGREGHRQSRRSVTFLGECPREVLVSALEVVAQGFGVRGVMDVKLKQWDALREWAAGRERIEDIFSCLYQTRRCGCVLTLFSGLLEVDSGLWEFIYQHRRVRLGWVGAGLLGCGSMEEVEAYRRESGAFRNLAEICNAGLWPHIVVPVSGANAGVLPGPRAGV